MRIPHSFARLKLLHANEVLAGALLEKGFPASTVLILFFRTRYVLQNAAMTSFPPQLHNLSLHADEIAFCNARLCCMQARPVGERRAGHPFSLDSMHAPPAPLAASVWPCRYPLSSGLQHDHSDYGS